MLRKQCRATLNNEILHFLAPRVFLRAASGSVKPATSTSRPGKPAREGRLASGSFTWNSDASSRTKPHVTLVPLKKSPAKKVASKETVLDNESPKPLTTVDPSSDRLRREMAQELSKADLPGSLRIWSKLKELEMLGSMTELQVFDLGELLSSYLARAPNDTPRKEAEEVAIWLAQLKSIYKPLNSALFFHIHNTSAEDAMALVQQFASSLPTSNQVEKQSTKEEEDYWETAFCAAIIYASQGDFPTFFQLYLKKPVFLLPQTLEELSKRIIPSEDAKLGSLVGRFFHRAVVSGRIARPTFLSKRLVHLHRLGQRDVLVSAINEIKQGVQEGWLKTELEKDGAVVLKENQDHSLELGGYAFVAENHWCLLLRTLWEAHYIPEARELWSWMEKYNIRRSQFMWSAHLDGARRAKSMVDVQQTLQEMSQKGVQPDVKTYSLLIDMSIKRGDVEGGMNLFHRMRDLCGPEEEWGKSHFVSKADLVLGAYNSTLDSLLRAKELGRVEEVLQEMNSKGPKPDIVTHNILLRRHMRAKDRHKFEATWEYIKTHPTIQPDKYTFAILLESMRTLHHNVIPELLRGIEGGMLLNTELLTSVVGVLLESARIRRGKAKEDSEELEVRDESEAWNDALLILDHMESSLRTKTHSTRPNEVTYTKFLGYITEVLNVGLVDEATALQRHERIVQGMDKLRVTPNRIMLEVMMNFHLACTDGDAINRALSVYRQSIKYGHAPRGSTYYALISGCYYKGDYEQAKEVIGDMAKFNFVPRAALLRLVERVQVQTQYR